MWKPWTVSGASPPIRPLMRTPSPSARSSRLPVAVLPSVGWRSARATRAGSATGVAGCGSGLRSADGADSTGAALVGGVAAGGVPSSGACPGRLHAPSRRAEIRIDRVRTDMAVLLWDALTVVAHRLTGHGHRTRYAEAPRSPEPAGGIPLSSPPGVRIRNSAGLAVHDRPAA